MRKKHTNLTIKALLAPRHLLFLLKGPKGPSVHPITYYFCSRAQRALSCPRKSMRRSRLAVVQGGQKGHNVVNGKIIFLLIINIAYYTQVPQYTYSLGDNQSKLGPLPTRDIIQQFSQNINYVISGIYSSALYITPTDDAE